MARGRLISKSLGSSRKFHRLLEVGGKLGEFCQVLYPLLIANTDDYGRMSGDAFTVKHVVLPSSPRSEHEFDIAIDTLQRVGLVTRYVVAGDHYLQVVDFDAHQPNLHKRTMSRFPAIPESPGNSGNLPDLPPQSNPEPRTQNLTQNPEGNPEPRTALTRSADDRFEDFWTAYPKKKSKNDARKAWTKLRPSADLLQTMLGAIAVQSRSRDWLKEGGQFIPYPASWLNAEGWSDVVTNHSGLSDTAAYNVQSMAEMERILREREATREH